MPTPLYRSRPGGFEIQPAGQAPAAQVHERIWLSQGLSNSWLVTTDAGRVVINTGMGFEGPVHRRNFDAVSTDPVRYLLFTQGHVDHVGGADAFLEEGTEVVAQAGNAAHQHDDARITAFRARRSAFAFSNAIGKATAYIRQHVGGAISPQATPVPTITFDDSYAFELGGVRFELYSTPGGETVDSLVVWLPEEKVCFSGNLFSALFGHFPNLVTVRGDRYREALRFVSSLERVRALEPEMLLVGHHDPVVGGALIQEELTRLRDAVQYVHDETVRGMNSGKDVYTLMREIRPPPELEVGEGYGKISWSVRAIWETYAGWFQHHSTTELYGQPPDAVDGDLVELAGGPDAVAERAQRKLAAGDAVGAVQLAEVALAATPAHAGALRASLAAHQRLEGESVNFWLSSWLQRQIDRLQAALEAAE